MAEFHRCWRCDTEVPMLDEEEWAEMEPLLRKSLRQIQECRAETGASLRQALENNLDLPALVLYRELTGYVETNFNAIWHHRRSDFGPKCPTCGNLLRTPRAKLCPECGFQIKQVT